MQETLDLHDLENDWREFWVCSIDAEIFIPRNVIHPWGYFIKLVLKSKIMFIWNARYKISP